MTNNTIPAIGLLMFSQKKSPQLTSLQKRLRAYEEKETKLQEQWDAALERAKQNDDLQEANEANAFFSSELADINFDIEIYRSEVQLQRIRDAGGIFPSSRLAPQYWTAGLDEEHEILNEAGNFEAHRVLKEAEDRTAQMESARFSRFVAKCSLLLALITLAGQPGIEYVWGQFLPGEESAHPAGLEDGPLPINRGNGQ